MTQRSQSHWVDAGNIAKIVGVVITVGVTASACLWYGISWAQDRQSETEARAIYETRERATEARQAINGRLDKLDANMQMANENLIRVGERLRVKDLQKSTQGDEQ